MDSKIDHNLKDFFFLYKFPSHKQKPFSEICPLKKGKRKRKERILPFAYKFGNVHCHS